MDRQTLLAFLLIGFIIVLYPWYMSIVSPPELNMVPPSTQPKELAKEKITPETKKEDSVFEIIDGKKYEKELLRVAAELTGKKEKSIIILLINILRL